MTRPLRIGTRASPLALAQAEEVRAALTAAHGLPAGATQIIKIIASGDKIQDRSLADIGGKALWTRELDQALARGEIDIAVHSMKDVETIRPPQFGIAAILERADVRDRLIGAASIVALRTGATLGTASPRRRAQLLRLRPDLRIELLRGNVASRIAKVERGEVGATLLAAAGLDRLGLHAMGNAIPLETMLPAASQGAIGVEVRANDERIGALVSAIDHATSRTCVLAERALLAALGGSCRSPVAALAQWQGERILLRAELYSLDGQEAVRGALMLSGDHEQGAGQLARDLLSRATASVRALFTL